MLKEIIALWKGGTFMGKVVEEFGSMLDDAEYVFVNAWESIAGGVSADKIKKSLYERDKSVNKAEREIRRRLVEHLSINPRQDVPGCLAMMSLVKDAERIGDYSKNIFDLAIILQSDAKELKRIGRFSPIQKKIANNFSRLKKAFMDSDDNLAKDILNNYASIKDECSGILSDLFKEDLPTQDAVATALLSRYFKRINSHISNIASGIVNPLDKLDFVRGDILE